MVCSFPSLIHFVYNNIRWYVGTFLWRCVFRSNCKSPPCFHCELSSFIEKPNSQKTLLIVKPISSSSLIAGGVLANSFNKLKGVAVHCSCAEPSVISILASQMQGMF